MEGYVGKPITEPILDYGPPSNVVELGPKRRAFQWKIDSSGVAPLTTPSSATIYTPTGSAWITSQSTTYVPYSKQCLYTLTATETDGVYVVDGFRQPKFSCL